MEEENNVLSVKLVQALLAARKAVQLDSEGEHSNAIKEYSNATKDLEYSAKLSSNEHQPDILQRSLMYHERVDALEKHMNSFSLFKPSNGFREVPVPKEVILETCPSSPLQRPFWLMRVLAESMLSGGFFTQTLYVPREIWYQANVKLSSIATKFDTCEILLGCLQKLSKEDVSASSDLLEKLAEFCAVLDDIHSTLSKSLSFIPPPNEKDAGGKFSDRMKRKATAFASNIAKATVEDDSEYIGILTRIFIKAQFLTKWISDHEAVMADEAVRSQTSELPEIHTHFQRVSQFFETVLCNFVIHDFVSLLSRYMKTNHRILME
eukprot:GCRY01004985.1.p1 GENE.GCRY01004985.1~~GCRY01004985.1.p1  ORF type:complete len:322 (+),score=48.54 GCRY01004985.1:91-1056(+)